MAQFDATAKHRGPGDQFFDSMDLANAERDRNALTTDKPAHALDAEDMRKMHRQLLEWYYYERERQSVNRMEMAVDHDFYDGLQWDPEDAADVESRGQMPLVYNEVAPMADWIIGTERRQRADWKVLPRAEDDVDLADTKTKVLKYVADVNRVQFERSRAFADAIKGGIGWLDDGARDDPTKDVLYSMYEDWRRVLHDSSGYDPTGEDGRYVFRWRWVDSDIAAFMFPDRKNIIEQATQEATRYHEWTEEEEWRRADVSATDLRSGHVFAAGFGTTVDARRSRVKLIEAQFRMPRTEKVVASGPLKGAIFDPRDNVLVNALNQVGGSIVDRIVMRVFVAVFTEAALLSCGPTFYRHNKFSLTPIFCYRRGRDRMPYGVIRRVRDIQQDLNKRASKALFMLNTNQIIADEGAVEDWEEARDEADRPDGIIKKKSGKEFEIRRDTDAATGQIQMMTLAGQSIQKSAGVTQENLGRQTNAVSGKAIEARQMQGSVVVTEPFDNLRLATQAQGEKQLSLTEQFYSEEKVIRLTGAQGTLEWVRINQPEPQPDGSVRILNDITASQADFIVSEQDYSGTLRQVMFESLNQLATRLPPEVSLRVLTIAMEFSDLPNKSEIADQIRALTGDRNPNKKLSPEEMAQVQQQMQAQAEALELQRQTAITALEEARAKVRELNAKAAKMEAEAQSVGVGVPPEVEAQMRRLQEDAARQIEDLSKKLMVAQQDQANRTMQIRADKDAKVQVATINADATKYAAEVQAKAQAQLDAVDRRMDDLLRSIQDVNKAATEAAQAAEEAKRRAEKIEKAPPAPAPAPAPAAAAAPAPAPAEPPAPITLNLSVDARGGPVHRTITMERDQAGELTKVDAVDTPVDDAAAAAPAPTPAPRKRATPKKKD